MGRCILEYRWLVKLTILMVIHAYFIVEGLATNPRDEGVIGNKLHINTAGTSSRLKRQASACPPDIDSIATGGVTRLQKAAIDGNLDEVRHLITDCGAGVDVPSKRGSTALHEASFNGKAEVVAFLIQSGADPDRMKTDGWAAIHLALDSPNSVGVLKALLDGGANANLKTAPPTGNGFQGTALELATDLGRQDVVKFLRDYQPSSGDSLTAAACLDEAMKRTKVDEVTRVLQSNRPFSAMLQFLRGLMKQCNVAV